MARTEGKVKAGEKKGEGERKKGGEFVGTVKRDKNKNEIVWN